MNHKYDPPFAVSCERLELDAHRLADVVGSLRDPEPARPLAPRRERTVSMPATLAGLARTVAAAEPGNRNNVLHWAACRVGEREIPCDVALPAIREAAERVGLDRNEIERTIASGLRSAAAK